MIEIKCTDAQKKRLIQAWRGPKGMSLFQQRNARTMIEGDCAKAAPQRRKAYD